MDLSDINKVASRKRVNTDAEKLREKMSRESSKIIKLRVAQDTAYWDLKERLRSVEGEHERLQRNMLDVQMQHEALSARYQDELRLRPETLNRLAGTREICDVLQEHAGRVRSALRRAAADRDALAHSYAAAARRVHAATHQAALHGAAAADRVAARESRVAQLAEEVGAARRECAAAEAARGAAGQLLHAAAERAAALQAGADTLRDQLHEKERTIAELRRDAELRATEAAAEKECTAALQRELQARADALTEARCALAAHEEHAALAAEEATYSSTALQNLKETGADLKRELEAARVATEALRSEIEEREREVGASEARAEAARGEAEEARAEAEAARAELREQREAAGAAATAAERALAERAETVARLMRDVAAEAEARGAADEQVRALTARLQTKENELTGQTNVVLEMRREKERLQDIIRGMQGTIDNIQKELTREAPAPAAAATAAAAAQARREPPERDVDELLYHFLSDSSMDADALDPNEVNARFEALSRGGPAPPAISLQALKLRKGVSASHARPALPAVSVAHADEVSLSQVKSELAARGRTFFRNKRLDAKCKKFK